jgi:hypothetical protein
MLCAAKIVNVNQLIAVFIENIYKSMAGLRIFFITLRPLYMYRNEKRIVEA